LPASRRAFLKAAGAALPAWAVARAPAIVTAAAARPRALQGLQFGDPGDGSVVVWSRSDRPSAMRVEWSRDESFADATRLAGPHALPDTDFTVRRVIDGLDPGSDVFVRVTFEALGDTRAVSEAVVGRFVVPPGAPARQGRGGGRPGGDLRFLWGGDTAGQGWGINPGFGGMRIYETMRRRSPHFFIHSGDTIYADAPISASVVAEGGQVWNNIVTPEVAKVAETLDEFRGRHRYNLLDENVRRFNAEVPQIWQWDDHEVVNNWSDSKDLSGDDRYTEKNIRRLAERAARAFREYAPMRPFSGRDAGRIYRKQSYGSLLDLFVLDMRSYRGPNTANLQPSLGGQAAFLGRAQLDWLKRGLEDSKATWKVVAADMPLGLNIPDGFLPGDVPRWEAVANGEDGGPRGRELEFAELLRHLKRRNVRNVVWVTADVHYCAAHYYDPGKASFTEFDGFWEFVAGPLNAGTFRPGTLDNTFGPQVVFFKAPAPGQANLSPLSGMQFFGEVNIDAQGGAMTVDLRDLSGASVFSRTLQPLGG
jgi:alkaline phosphatase D